MLPLYCASYEQLSNAIWLQLSGGRCYIIVSLKSYLRLLIRVIASYRVSWLIIIWRAVCIVFVVNFRARGGVSSAVVAVFANLFVFFSAPMDGVIIRFPLCLVHFPLVPCHSRDSFSDPLYERVVSIFSSCLVGPQLPAR